MAVDMKVWLSLVNDAVTWLSNEGAQRNAWLGIGPYIDSPDETFNGYLDDAAIEEFLKRDDTGLNVQQLDSLRSLTKLVSELCEETNIELKRENLQFLPPEFIDDPRWQEVIRAAKRTKEILG